MSLEAVANITLEGDSAPRSLSISEQAFLNFNILRIRDSLGITTFFSDQSMSEMPLGVSALAPHLRGPTCLNTNDPNRVVSMMNNYGDDRAFPLLTISNMEIAALQPKIELRKIIFEGSDVTSGKPIYEGIIPFKTNSSGNFKETTMGSSLLQASPDRADDVQVSNVSFDFKNQNPLGAGRMVDVKIELVLSQGRSLTSLRNLRGGERMSDSSTDESILKTFKFTDLFLRPYGADATSYNRNAYQIRANIGWKTESSNKLYNQLGDGYNLTREAIESQEISLNLLLVNYDISFRQDGKLSLVLDYISTLEDAFEDERTNIFSAGMGNLMGENTSAELIELTKELTSVIKELETSAILKEELRSALALSRMSNNDHGMGVAPSTYIAETQRLRNVTTEISNLEVRREDIQRRVNALNAGLVLTPDGTANTVLMHSKILKKIHESGRLLSFVLPKKQLIYYSENYQKNLMGADPTLFFDALTEVENISDSIFGTPTTSASTGHFYRSRGSSVPNFASELTAQLMALPEINNNPGKAAAASGIDLSQAFRGTESSGRAFVFNPVFGTSTGYRSPRTVSDPENHVFYFFFYGDLIAAAMGMHGNQMAQQMVEEKIGVILNSILYTRDYPIPPAATSDPSITSGARTTPPEEININLAHVPITLDSYFNFFKENIIDKKRERMPLGDFIRETLTKLVAPALNTKSFGSKPRDRVVLKASTIEVARTPISYADSGGATSSTALADEYDPLLTFIQPIPHAAPGMTAGPAAVLLPTSFADFHTGTRIGNKFVKDKIRMRRLNKYQRFSYLSCYGTSKSSMISGLVAPKYTGNFVKDQRSGIYHLAPASSHGLVKDIRFSKRAIRYLSEASVFSAIQGDSSDGFTRLWNVFDVQVIMVGNNLFVPGSLLYINTANTGLGNPSDKLSVSRVLGLGGYYLVVSVTNQIVQSGAGRWETTVKAIWQSSGRNYK